MELINYFFRFSRIHISTKTQKNKYENYYANFLLTIADKAKKAIRKEMRDWRLQLNVYKNLQYISNSFLNYFR